MVICYEPVKNLDALESRFGKLLWLIHPETINELSQIENTARVKRSKIANLSLKIIKDRVKRGDFRYVNEKEIEEFETKKKNIHGVDSMLLDLSIGKKCPLATIDKNLIRRALKKGVDVITLKSNRIIFVHSDVRST